MNFGDSERTESRIRPATGKFTATQEETLLAFVDFTGMSKSDVAHKGSNVVMRFYPHHEKLIKYANKLIAMIECLP